MKFVGSLKNASGAHSSQTAIADRMLVWLWLPENVRLMGWLAADATHGRNASATTDTASARARRPEPLA
jgi:hypothetical protein